jgi:hypothetical protein
MQATASDDDFSVIHSPAADELPPPPEEDIADDKPPPHTQPSPSFLQTSNSTLLLITLPSLKPIAYVPCATVQDIMLPTVAPRRSYSKTVASIQQPLTLSVNSATTTGAANVVDDAAMKHATAASSARSPTTSKAPLLRCLPAYSLKQL